jgi:hypothetical protein
LADLPGDGFIFQGRGLSRMIFPVFIPARTTAVN